MCENSGVSSIAALREARRRKILENSADRLKLIEGIKSSAEVHCAEKCLEPTTKSEIKTSKSATKSIEPESKINSKLNDYLKDNKDLKEISDFILRGDKNIEEEEESEVLVIDRKWGKTFSKTFFDKKLHYILLALVVNIMLVCNVGHLFYENIFCPFYTVKLMEVLSKREVEQLQPVLLLFIASLPKKFQKLTRVILVVLSILLSDLCLYLFTFFVGNKLTISLE